MGRKGERIAREFLENKQYKILCQNWHAGRYGEIDLVALSPGLTSIVFIEVKTRRTNSHGFPIEALTLRKRMQMSRIAALFMGRHPQFQKHDIRFDFVGIYQPMPRTPIEIQHLENIFQ